MEVHTWDDENAKVPSYSIESHSLSQILDLCDFFVITRKTVEIEKIYNYIYLSNKNFIDLWSQ